MPANLTPMYRKAEEAFRQATTTADKIAALEEMYATLPKHKGTEKMQADIRQRLSHLREAGQKEKVRGGVDIFHVTKQGAGQFVLIGTPNSGKSALVAALTKAHVTVAPYPFSTHAPVPGMMPYEDIQIQLVDMPPITPEGFALVITHIFVPLSSRCVQGADYGESLMQTALMTVKDWAVAEFGGADLHDQRRSQRLVQVAAQLASDPHGRLPESFGQWRDLKAAYRLLEEAGITHEAILASHTARVRQECRRPGEYLFVEDTTELDFSSHPAAEDLGLIGNGGGRGLFVHSTLAMRVDSWNAQQEPQVTLPGLAAQYCWVRPEHKAAAGERKPKRLARPRESQRWAACVEEIGPPPAETRYTFMADREADIWETLGRCQDHQWDFIVRANQPRALAEQDGSVFEAVAAAPVVATL